MPAIRRKLVTVGDHSCGKTCLLIVGSQGTFSGDNRPITPDHVLSIDSHGTQMELALCDTAGHEHYDRLRPLCYPDTGIVLACFTVDSPDSLQNVREKWVPEVWQFCGERVPLLLVGCKIDLRANRQLGRELELAAQRVVTTEQGVAMQRRIGARAYLECSAKTGEGVQEIFQAAAQIAASIERCSSNTKGHAAFRKCVVF